MVLFLFFIPFILTLMLLTTTSLNFMVKALTVPEEQNFVGNTMLQARVESTTKDWFHVRMNPDWPIELLQERSDPWHHLPPNHPLSHAHIKCMTYSACAALGGGTSSVANAACTEHHFLTHSCGDFAECQSEDGKCDSGHPLICPYATKCSEGKCCITMLHG